MENTRHVADDGRIAKLLAKSTHAAAHPDALAAFDVGPMRGPRAAWHPAARAAASQLFHAEAMTARMCALTAPLIATEPARSFLAIQAVEEDRHARLYARYLGAVGDAQPMDPSLGRALEAALGWCDLPEAALTVFHVLLEGEAIVLHRAVLDELPCPTLHAITRSVVRDEARHTAFGRIYLRQALSDRDAGDRREIYRRARVAWAVAAEPGPGLVAAMLGRRRRTYMERRWRHYQALLGSLGLSEDGRTS